MIDPYRWTLDEYVLRCEHGTDLAEVVVEGELDRDIIGDSLNRWGLEDVTVLDSDYIAILAEEIAQAGFNPGAKGRLATLAAALDTVSQDSSIAARVVVIVDHDYDGAPLVSDYLLVTDGYSMESYAMSERVFERFLRVALGRAPLPAGSKGRPERRTTCTGRELYQRIAPAACTVGAVRLLLRAVGQPLALFDSWSDYVRVRSDGHLLADGERLLENVLRAARRADEYENLRANLPDATARVSSNMFLLVRGHDFVTLLVKVFRGSWGRRLTGSRFNDSAAQSVLSRLLALAVDPAELDSFPLFQQLRVRMAPPGA